jgi:formylglycine-generating enzyme required for sulfatase activity
VAGGENPSQFQDDAQQPVEQVSWDNVMQQFMPKLQVLLPAGCEATLPSEAQWEYACRAGSQTTYAWGDQADHELANVEKEVGKTTPVDQYPANPWGLFDMHGNVWEWCFDAHRTYANEKTVDPLGAVGGGSRALRGGSWDYGAWNARSAYRLGFARGRRFVYYGFRVALRFKPSK